MADPDLYPTDNIESSIDHPLQRAWWPFLGTILAFSMAGLTVAGAAAFSLYILFFEPSLDNGSVTVVTAPGNQESEALSQSQVGPSQQDLSDYCVILTESANSYVGTTQRASLLRTLKNLSHKTVQLFVNLRIALSKDYLRFGESGEAVRLLEEAMEAVNQSDSYGDHKKIELLEALAVTNLKRGELDNCLTPGGSLICTLPLDNSVFQENDQGSAAAIDNLTQWLGLQPENVKAMWLLNIAHMTLGTYPDEVPEGYLISRDKFEAGYDIGRFQEISPLVGLYQVNLAGGSVVEDFDNDGLLDIMISTWDPCGAMSYFNNDGNGIFTDYTQRAGLGGQLGGLNISQTDYNNDGWMDALVMRGGWMQQAGRMRMSLLRNNSDGTFSDVTHEAGLAFPEYPSHSAVWADYDNDGNLDLFSCNESTRILAEGASGRIHYPSQLFHNNGDGTFTDVAKQAGVTNLRYCKGSVWGDYDDDGDPDLYVSNFSDENRLYRNNGDGTFADVATDLGVTEPEGSFATWFWDYDNDGFLDLFVTGYGTDIEDVGADYLGIPNDGARPRLFRNDGSGGFADVTREAGLYRVHLTMGANFGDLDNDGFPDFYLGTGAPPYDAISPNIMYRNNSGKSFLDVTFSGGFGHLQKGHGVAFGDLDRDGDQDLFVQIGGFFPGDSFSNALYENPGHGNRWLSVKLKGVQSNRAGIGARIKVQLETDQGNRDVYAHVNSGGSFGASSLEQEIGLGQAERIVSLEVYWPTSGIRQLFSDVPLDSHIEILENNNEYKLLDIPKIDF